MQIIGDIPVVPLDSEGDLPVKIQDQTTTPIDALFSQSVSNFTIAVQMVPSTVSVLSYSFTASPAHGIVIGNEVLLLDTAANRVLQGVVKNVVADVITIDRPIDHAFAVATTLGRIIITNMNVVGSLASPQIFSIRAGAIPSDLTRFVITMIDDTSMDDGKFGGIVALANGLVFRVIDGFQKTIFNFKTNGEIGQFCYDVKYSDKAPAGQFGLTARISFAGQDKHGVALRIKDTDVLQWIVQDDLTGLASMRISAMGHDTEGEQ